MNTQYYLCAYEKEVEQSFCTRICGGKGQGRCSVGNVTHARPRNHEGGIVMSFFCVITSLREIHPFNVERIHKVW